MNPAHLWLGTRTDNMADKVAKGRQARFMRAKLSMEKAAEIRRLSKAGVSWSKLAKQFGVATGTIQSLLQGRTWR